MTKEHVIKMKHFGFTFERVADGTVDVQVTCIQRGLEVMGMGGSMSVDELRALRSEITAALET